MPALQTEDWSRRPAPITGTGLEHGCGHELSGFGGDVVKFTSRKSDSIGYVIVVNGAGRQRPRAVRRTDSVREEPEVTRARCRVAWEHIQERLNTFALLPEDWDAEGAGRVPEIVLENAHAFVAEAVMSGVPAPELYLDGGGEVGFRWRKFSWFASVSFLEDGHGLVYLETAKTGEPVRVDSPWPWTELENRDSIFAALKAFA